MPIGIFTIAVYWLPFPSFIEDSTVPCLVSWHDISLIILLQVILEGKKSEGGFVCLKMCSDQCVLCVHLNCVVHYTKTQTMDKAHTMYPEYGQRTHTQTMDSAHMLRLCTVHLYPHEGQCTYNHTMDSAHIL